MAKNGIWRLKVKSKPVTEKIEKLLTHYPDHRLAGLQRAAEDGTLVYQDTCKCLLHHFRPGYYSDTKWCSELSPLAREAELEFMFIGAGLIIPDANARRREVILPLIQAEWARRGQPLPVTFEQPAKQEALRK